MKTKYRDKKKYYSFRNKFYVYAINLISGFVFQL